MRVGNFTDNQMIFGNRYQVCVYMRAHIKYRISLYFMSRKAIHSYIMFGSNNVGEQT